MNQQLAQLLARNDAVVGWRSACAAVPRHIVEYAAAAGHVRLLFPGVLVAPDRAEEADVRHRAALCYAGPNSALSHVSALQAWGLPADDRAAVHVLTDADRRIRVAGIRAHRRVGFVASAPDVAIRDGLRVVRLERAIVDAWPCRRGDAQRSPVLYAVNARLTTPQRLRAVLADVPNLPGRRSLDTLLTKLAEGCRSELELWGYDRIFSGPQMPPLQRQVRIRLGMRAVDLDVYDPQTQTNFELDGAKWHASPVQRERDLRRDAALAALGLQVVRFTHDRMVAEPDRVRAEVLAILAARRLTAGGPGAALDAQRQSWRV